MGGRPSPKTLPPHAFDLRVAANTALSPSMLRRCHVANQTACAAYNMMSMALTSNAHPRETITTSFVCPSGPCGSTVVAPPTAWQWETFTWDSL